MLPALALSLLGHQAQPPGPAARLDAFLKAHKTLRAAFTVTANGGPAVAGTLRIARPDRLRLDVKGKGLDYSVVSTPQTYLEIERAERTYDERPSSGGFRLYDSRFSQAPTLLPGFLLAGSTAAIVGDKPTVEAVPEGDALSATISTQEGPVNLRLVVAPSGQPLAFSTKGPRGGYAWRVTSLDANAADPAAYRIDIPSGYVPYALPDLPTPLAIGEAAPLVGWRRGGRAFDLNDPQRGRPRLLAVLGADSPPSRAAVPFLLDLGKSMPVFLIGPGELQDPTGALLKRLSPPGTPMFYLVGPDGAVKKLWLGFDPAKGRAWEDEVRAAAK